MAIPLRIITPPATPGAEGPGGEGGERKNFKGVLKGVIDDKVEIVCDGQPFQLPIADIDHAKLVPDWDAVMHGRSGVGMADQPKPIKPGHRPSSKPQKHQKQKH